LIFVIDSADEKRVEEAAKELGDLLKVIFLTINIYLFLGRNLSKNTFISIC